MATILGSAIGGLASGAASQLFSKKPPTPTTYIPSIDAGGLKTNVTISGGKKRKIVTTGVSASPEREELISGLRGLYTGRAGEIRGLLPQVAPGLGRLTEAGLQSIQTARERLDARRSRAVGNLRENLAKRRVLGSSFGMSALASAEGEFNLADRELMGEENRIKATSFLQELDLTNQLLSQASAMEVESFNTALNEMNLQANLASQLATGTASTLQSAGNLQAQLLTQYGQQNAAVWGYSMQPFIDGLNKTVSDKVANIFSTSTGVDVAGNADGQLY